MLTVQVSSNDHVHTVLRNTFTKYNVSCKPEEFCIVQLLPDKTGLLSSKTESKFQKLEKLTHS